MVLLSDRLPRESRDAQDPNRCDRQEVRVAKGANQGDGRVKEQKRTDKLSTRPSNHLHPNPKAAVTSPIGTPLWDPHSDVDRTPTQEDVFYVRRPATLKSSTSFKRFLRSATNRKEKGEAKESGLDAREAHLRNLAQTPPLEEGIAFPHSQLPRVPPEAKKKRRKPSLRSRDSSDSLKSNLKAYSSRIQATTSSFLKRFSSPSEVVLARLVEGSVPFVEANVPLPTPAASLLEAASSTGSAEGRGRARGLFKEDSDASIHSYIGSESSLAISRTPSIPNSSDARSISSNNPYSRHFRTLQNKSSGNLTKIEGSPPEEEPPAARPQSRRLAQSKAKPELSIDRPSSESVRLGSSPSVYHNSSSFAESRSLSRNSSPVPSPIKDRPDLVRSQSETSVTNMPGDKSSGGGWRSRFGKKSLGAEGSGSGVDPLSEAMNIEKQNSNENLRKGREGKAGMMLGFDAEREMAAQHIARQQRAAKDGRVDNVVDLLDGMHRSSLAGSPTNRLKEYQESNRGAGASSMGRSKLERMMGDQVAANEYARQQPGSNAVDAYPTSASSASPANQDSHLDMDETSCPVCLELLSFRLAGEKPHVTPSCGHALHHACFTAVYGSPEAILASQNAPGRAPAPGMCGVCRKLIVLGDEGENRRQNKLAGMMGVSDHGSNHQGPMGSLRGRNDLPVESARPDDDPLDIAHARHRSRDALREMNGYAASVAQSANGHLSPLLNDDSLSQTSSRGMLYPSVKVRPEYGTIYRKERSGDQSKQNVVCVISVAVPSRRGEGSAEEDEQLWMQKIGRHELSTIKDDVADDELTMKSAHVDRGREREEAKDSGASTGDDDEADERKSHASDDEEGFSFGATPAAVESGKVSPFTNVVEDLRRRISDWKGHAVDRFGPLILYDFLGVRQESVVREFYVYLFKEALLCVTEERKKEKGLARLIGSDKSSNGAHHFEEIIQTGPSGSNGRQNRPALKLKGRIWLRHIRRCQEIESDSNGHCLSIKLDDESLDHFVLCFKEVGHRETWKKRLTDLLEQHHKARESETPSSSNKEASQELPSPAVQQQEAFEDAKATQPARRHTSVSGHSIQSGKSGSNNLASPSTSVTTPKSVHSTTLTSPRVGSTSAFSDLNSHGKMNAVKARTPPLRSSIPGLPHHQQWSASGGLDPSLPPPDLLPHTPIDLVLMVSVPSVVAQPAVSSSTLSSSAALKLRLIRSTLDFVISHLGPNDRVALVAYNVGVDGLVRRTSLLSPSKEQSKEKLEQFVDTIGKPWEGPGLDPFLEDVDRLGGSTDRTDTVTAVNIGFDIVLQRKSKNAVTSMILINDTADAPRRGQMDLVMARAEAANVPVHCFGFGKSHDPSSLWLISNHTRGSYTFVKEWYQLRECVSGCIGSMMSVALTDVKLHVSVPSDNHFKVRKVAGLSGAIISSSGKDVDIEIGELRFGDCKELFVELELDFKGLYASIPGRRGVEGEKRTITDHYEKGSATDDFMQRLGLQGLSLSGTEQVSPQTSYDHTAAMEGNFVEEVVVLEVDCGCKDPSIGASTNRLPNPGVLTLEIDVHSTDPITEASAGSAGLATALADPVVTRRRLEILVSDMITRCLLLVSRRNHSQAMTILLETRRIVDTVLQAIPVEQQQYTQQDIRLAPHRQAGQSMRNSQAKKQRDNLHRKTALSLFAILDDLDVLIDGLESNQHVSFERTERNFGAQQAMALRDQKAWTSRTDTEWHFHRDIDNAAPFAALAATLAVSGPGR